ncbi:MAG: dihydrofolate reductase [Candidatus Paceibacterota bacterium]
MTNSNHITISAIAALGNQRQIGKDNELLWNIPEDLERFKELTSGKAVIMGRKTWQSLPESVRPLPDRENIILTRDEDFDAPGGMVKHSLDDAISYAKAWSRDNMQEEVFIIGGATIYEQALPETDKLFLTLVDSDEPGDAFFPEYESDFNEVEKIPANSDGIDYVFVNLERK